MVVEDSCPTMSMDMTGNRLAGKNSSRPVMASARVCSMLLSRGWYSELAQRGHSALSPTGASTRSSSRSQSLQAIQLSGIDARAWVSVLVTILDWGNPRPAFEGTGKIAGLGEAQQVGDLTQ